MKALVLDWIASSLAALAPRNDAVCGLYTNNKKPNGDVMSNASTIIFPKTLLGFYMKHAFGPYATRVSVFIFMQTTLMLWWALGYAFYNRWFLELFEQTPPDGVSFVQFAAPTVLVIVGLVFFFDMWHAVENTLWSRSRDKIRNHISSVLYRYLHKQSMTYFQTRLAGKMDSQVKYIAEGFIFDEIGRLLAAVMALIIGTFFINQMDWRFAVLLLSAMVFRFTYGYWRMRPMIKSSEEHADAASLVTGKLIDSLSNFSIVKLFAGRKREEDHVRPMRAEQVRLKERQRYMQRLFWLVPSVVDTFMSGAAMMICVSMYQSGDIAISGIVFTMMIFWAISHQINNIVDMLPNITDHIGSAVESYTKLVRPIDIVDTPNAKKLRVKNGWIEVRNVAFNYGQRDVLNGVSLTIQPGEKVGLVGISGAGKTTLVNLLMRFYDPTGGAIFIDGQNIKKVKQDSLRENIAFIPQDPTMFNRTLRENIGYGKPGATDEEIIEAAKCANAHDFIMATEKGYDSLVGDRGIKLSGGQRQRIAIARAFLKDAPILVLDEATSALDSETEFAIQKSFDELSRGRTTVVIAHRLSTLRNMDRIVVMDRGQIVESGTHSELLTQGGTYAYLWQMQSGGFLHE